MEFLKSLKNGIPLDPLPGPYQRDENLPHAPKRIHDLNDDDKRLAIKNSLRYFPPNLHSILCVEFQQELENYGHIYMYRFRPKFPLKAYPIGSYPAECQEGAAIMLMIMNNLDPNVAQFPEELVCYGGNGQVFSNWAQFWITMKYLSHLQQNQTLVLSSGHPIGLFPSLESSSRMLISNGIMVPNYSSKDDYNRFFALGVTMYGQMTAGSFCYIGSQGIVHGTTITILNAARKYLNTDDLSGKVFVSSGLGGMSGAQPKAGVIAGCITVVAEISLEALDKRKRQGWVMEVQSDLKQLIERIKKAKKDKEIISIGYHGNIVDLWETFAQYHRETKELLVDLGSDQTSCHCPFSGGYYPVGISYEDAKIMLQNNPDQFKKTCEESLRRQVIAINYLTDNGMHFWDYGNAFLLEAYRAGADLSTVRTSYGLKFKYPSYVQDIMGDVFSLGFGPFRWICTSGEEIDLKLTDEIALKTMKRLLNDFELGEESKKQYWDNIRWIENAQKHHLVVGSKARILYADHNGRVAIAQAFNEAVKNNMLKGPIVISRDHHDVSGADSPFRETSNIYDGSAYTADMATLTVLGNATRGATWVALHNGGGVGFGEALNCGFGLVLDGRKETEEKAKMMLFWDVTNGMSRRSWSGNSNAIQTIEEIQKTNPNLIITKNYLP
ncbi:Urocanate hydratase [Sarcoptes scabiei]|uniref:urocanate hydratase n=1 Tax=Sarcoptes scabiei TaxID=52283 RepID=A0A132A1Y2_SARSC|nr:Urocanate hydratase [Sarcoptes scabiei]KPM04943.1 urocanate hydratase-like protein [Sarcoptes scabiei]